MKSFTVGIQQAEKNALPVGIGQCLLFSKCFVCESRLYIINHYVCCYTLDGGFNVYDINRVLLLLVTR